MARTGTPPREKTYVYRTGRPDRLRPLLFAVAALILCAGIGAVLWHEWQGTRPTAAEQAARRLGLRYSVPLAVSIGAKRPSRASLS